MCGSCVACLRPVVNGLYLVGVGFVSLGIHFTAPGFCSFRLDHVDLWLQQDGLLGAYLGPHQDWLYDVCAQFCLFGSVAIDLWDWMLGLLPIGFGLCGPWFHFVIAWHHSTGTHAVALWLCTIGLADVNFGLYPHGQFAPLEKLCLNGFVCLNLWHELPGVSVICTGSCSYWFLSFFAWLLAHWIYPIYLWHLVLGLLAANS